MFSHYATRSRCALLALGLIALGASAVQAGSLTFSNGAGIAIPSYGPANPSPSEITVSGVTGTVTKVTATLSDLSHSYYADLGVLLVGPGGQSVVLMNYAGDGWVEGVSYTFDDDAENELSFDDWDNTGTYRPTNYWTSATFAGAPGPYGTSLSAFAGTDVNGTWKLYVQDFASGDAGQIADGWSLGIESTDPAVAAVPTPAAAVAALPLLGGLAMVRRRRSA